MDVPRTNAAAERTHAGRTAEPVPFAPEPLPHAPEPLPLWMLFPLLFAAVYLCHITLLRLPYFWDEAGYYIPAAWDLFHTGTLIPQSTVTNAHPPLPSIVLAGWWRIAGFAPSATRTLVCMVAAAGLLGVYRMAQRLAGTAVAIATTLLTGLYPVWFAQSTLAHADIFAAAFTLWGLSVYLEQDGLDGGQDGGRAGGRGCTVAAAVLFSLAALSKETAVVTPGALAVFEGVLFWRVRRSARERRRHGSWMVALASPVAPLSAWYAYHRHRTGFVFGNPEYLRYNATANLDAHRILLCLYHRLLHLTLHMNLFVPVLCAVATLLVPRLRGATRLRRRGFAAMAVVLGANWVAFSVLGGALLTRYLLPMYPLVLLVCVAEWAARLPLRHWAWLAALSSAAFVTGAHVNPPYAFAPEDNLTYRDFVVLHQQAVAVIAARYPEATVLTAWPAFAELERPELGYTKRAIKAVPIENFSFEQIEHAAQDPGSYDTALLFSTKWAPARGAVDLAGGHRQADAKYFDFHEDMRPAVAAAMLHGEVVWQGSIRGEWAAVLRFPRVVEARLGRGPG
ncbi:MAG: glycosyltransferase family 39 protein [Acidobacteriota bacterium]|nr:glycosyltransferase family 39 protein [Acidobacteriota bacterium]